MKIILVLILPWIIFWVSLIYENNPSFSWAYLIILFSCCLLLILAFLKNIIKKRWLNAFVCFLFLPVFGFVIINYLVKTDKQKVILIENQIKQVINGVQKIKNKPQEEKIKQAQNISAPSSVKILNMLRQMELVQRTEAAQDRRQKYLKVNIKDVKIGYGYGRYIADYKTELALGLLKRSGKEKLYPTEKARELNDKYFYYYYPNKVLNVSPVSYSQRNDSINCIVQYESSLSGVPKILLDNDRALNKHVSKVGNLYSLARHEKETVTFLWNEKQSKWVLKTRDVVYNYQPKLIERRNSVHYQ